MVVIWPYEWSVTGSNLDGHKVDFIFAKSCWNYVYVYMVCVSACCSQIGILCVVVSGIMYTAIENLAREYGV